MNHVLDSQIKTRAIVNESKKIRRNLRNLLIPVCVKPTASTERRSKQQITPPNSKVKQEIACMQIKLISNQTSFGKSKLDKRDEIACWGVVGKWLPGAAGDYTGVRVKNNTSPLTLQRVVVWSGQSITRETMSFQPPTPPDCLRGEGLAPLTSRVFVSLVESETGV